MQTRLAVFGVGLLVACGGEPARTSSGEDGGVGASCGDGVVQAGEDCDDGNTVSGDGCEVFCTYTCASDTDCDDSNQCNGAEVCDTSTHLCSTGGVPAVGARCTTADGSDGHCSDSEICLEDPYPAVLDQGLGQYVDSPTTVPTRVSNGLAITGRPIQVHHFSSENRGPVCMYGAPYFVETRDGPSDTLMIFMQGGGVCTTEVCAATPSPLLSLQTLSIAGLIGVGGLLDVTDRRNPARDFDMVNAPYCDGSLFAGDVDRVLSDGNFFNGPNDRAYQRGLQNLTATLRVAAERYPNPPRIILAGSSGGAYGVVLGVVLTRHFYPHTPLLVLSDSGAPVANGIDRDFIRRALAEFNALHLIPEDCTDCVANGHATGIIEWALERDPNLSVAYMSHARDYVIGEFFMGTTAEQFEAAVVAESGRLLERFPGRAYRFVTPGRDHTYTMGLDGIPGGLLGIGLALIGVTGIVLTGDDVNPFLLARWRIGGLNATGRDSEGNSWSAYEWLDSLFNTPASTPSVLQLD